jgi:hypothetical protein
VRRIGTRPGLNVLKRAGPRWQGGVARMQQLVAGRRRERQVVPGSGPLLVLGWSDLVPALLARMGGNGRSITLLTAMPIADLREKLAGRLPGPLLRRIRLRRGDIGHAETLASAGAGLAETVIVMAPEGADPLSRQLRCLLALVPLRQGRSGILVEVEGGAAAETVRLAGKGLARPVRALALAARFLAHGGREPRLQAVYEALLGPAHPPMRIGDHPGLEGMSFADATLVFGEAVPLGIADATGRAFLNPAPGTLLGEGLQPILLASFSADAAHVSALPLDVDREALRTLPQRPRDPERILALGWSPDMAAIARDLNRVVAPGSILTIAADIDGLGEKVGALPLGDGALAVEFGRIDPTDRTVLSSIGLSIYDRVMVFGDAANADARALATLLALGQPEQQTPIVAMLAEERHRPHAQATGSPALCLYRDRLAAMAFGFAAEAGPAAAILDDLLDMHGMQIALRDPAQLVHTTRPINFFTITEACRQRGELAIGHFIQPEPELPPTLVLNPIKARRVSYRPDDRIVVLVQGAE